MSCARGITKQIIGLMFKPGFTTAADVSGDAGRGIGMDVIISRVQRLKAVLKLPAAAARPVNLW